MSTKYFLLTKDSIVDNQHDQVVSPNREMTFVLPTVNLPYYHEHGLFENRLIEWCKQFCHPDGMMLDIGAHTGTYSICLAELCERVFAFEPQRLTFYALCGGVALSNRKNIHCFQLGLGSPAQVGMTSLKIRSHDGGGSSICDIDPDAILDQEPIMVHTLDAVMEVAQSLEPSPLPPIRFIKMDVEYNELNVLRGAKSTLTKNGFPLILFEANEGDTVGELFAYLEKELPYRVVAVNGYGNMYLATPITPSRI